MLNTIEARTDGGQLLSLPLFEAPEGFIVKSIDGLDPVDAVLGYSTIANLDDEQEQSSKRVKRNIVIVLGYDPDYQGISVESLRARLYRFFMPKTQVRLRFISDGMPTVEIVGRVEKMNAPLFARDPEATISIICAKANFVGMTEKNITGVTNNTVGMLQNFDYLGTTETGGRLNLRPNRNLASFTIHSYSPDGVLRSQLVTFPMINGDMVDINSVPLSKSARLTRSGATQSILYGISPESQWFTLFPGVNRIRIDAVGAAIPWTFYFAEKYGGL